MSRDYRMPDYSPYLHMHELQPAEAAPLAASTPAGQHYPYPPRHQQLSNSSTTPAYEMTSAGSACASGATLPPAPSLHHLDPRKRKSSHFDGDYELSDTQCSGSERSEAVGGGGGGGAGGSTRNRNSSSFGTASVYDDDCGEDTRSSHANTSAMPDKKQNHSEIEKRRRDKMNTYITELSSMIPMCGAISRKLDKLTVLRMAVQHLRTLRGSLSACPFTARPRPAFVSERELNGLLLQAASNSFLIVVSCDRGRLLYVSHSVSNMLHYDQSELLGQSMFDILHPKDVAKVKEQLSSSDLSPRERLIDAKTMLPVKSDAVAGAQRLGTGARRSFFCRIKCKQEPQQNSSTTPASVKEEAEANTNHRKKKYCVVQCTGYLKSWAPAEIENESCPEGDDEQFTMSCLVAVGRALTDLIPPHAPAPQTRRLQYVSRHAIDGKFLFVDPRVTLALGFLPQELLGTSLYEYVIGPELGAVVRTHKQALISQDPLHTPPYSFRRKDGTIATVQTHFKPFRNPWTKDVECLVANNSIVSDPPDVDKLAQQQYEAFKQTDEWRDYLTGIKDDRSDDERGCEPSGGGGGAGRRAGDDERAGEPTGGVAVAGGGNGGDSNDANPSSSESNAEVQRLIDSQVESHKIGSAIADEAFRCPPSPDQLSPLPAHLLQDPTFNASLMDNILGVDLNPFTVRNNVIQSTAVGQPPSPARGSVAPAASASPPLGLDGNGEAAMAVIMSLLEADAGLGGPVNISGLPWPLP